MPRQPIAADGAAVHWSNSCQFDSFHWGCWTLALHAEWNYCADYTSYLFWADPTPYFTRFASSMSTTFHPGQSGWGQGG
jgi:hypothetical protein